MNDLIKTLGFGRSLGVMQGRLGPMSFGAYQAFPSTSWRQEFDEASKRQLGHIEWVVDTQSLEHNPLLHDPNAIIQAVRDTNVQVLSVCADFLMDTPLTRASQDSWKIFDQVVRGLNLIGATHIIIPCVDHASVRDEDARRDLQSAVHCLYNRYGNDRINLALETDLDAGSFASLLADTDHAFIGVNYDIGNSASLGYSPAEEFDAYGDRITLVHVKDRRFRGGSVPLGTGNADLAFVMRLLSQNEFVGPVTLQCFRDKEGLSVFDEQLAYLNRLARTL